MVITVPDFLDWKSQPVTKAVFDEINTLIQDGAYELASTAGDNQILDRYRVGFIAGLRAVLAIDHNDVEGKE